MTFLDCTVVGCVYNEDRCCCKGNIKVGGEGAEEKRETCCVSFHERTAENIGNVAKRISKMTDISCEAFQCVFNDNEKCNAEHIGVAGGDACRCEETECASFRKRVE